MRNDSLPRKLVQVGKALLLSSLLLALFFAAVNASGNHHGTNGPDGEFVYMPASFPNFGGWVWGKVYVEGQPRAGITVTMRYQGKSIAVPTVEIPVIDDDPVFLFGTLPHTELSATYGSVVTLTVLYNGQTQSKRITLIPNAIEHQQDPLSVMSQPDEIGVSFVFGSQPIYRNHPPIHVDSNPTTTLSNLPQVHTLSVGYGHTCVVIGTTAQCWGRNDQHYQLGDGTAINRNHPIIPIGLNSGVRAIAAGESHSCAVMWSGKVKCWGWNYYGNLGPPLGSRSVPSDVIGIDNAVDVVAGDLNTCALLADTKVKCWGYNSVGQLGNGTTTGQSPNMTPTLVLDENRQPLQGVTALSTKYLHVCAVANSGLFCWGDTGYAPWKERTLLARAIISPSSGIVGVDTPAFYAGCMLKASGEVECWNGSALQPISGLPTNIIKVASGAGISCALTSHGELWCWGDNWLGLLPPDESRGVTTAVKLPFVDPNVVDVALGYEHICVRTTDNQIRCWGNNYLGQLGDGSAPTRPLTQTVSVKVPEGIQQIVTAGSIYSRYNTWLGRFTCVLTLSGGVQCWGGNLYGQLGNGKVAPISTEATLVTGLTSGVLQIASGYFHSCAIDATRQLWCWGRNDQGQLGIGSTENRSVPVQVPGLQGVRSIALAGNYSCAVLLDGKVKCWGVNTWGQLGTGTGNSSLVPVDVTQLAGPVGSLAVSFAHACALLESGATQCWGNNTFGELGIYSNTLRSTIPVTVPGVTGGASDLAVRQYNSCVIQNGVTKCWGKWQKRNPANVNDVHDILMPPTIITGWASSLVNIQFTSNLCGLLTSGSVQCAKLITPDGVSSFPTTFVTMTEFTNNVVALSRANDAPPSHSCAVLGDNTARCMGDDHSGELGTGTQHFKYTPVQAQIVEPAQWTYMLYLVGDNDLSSYLDNIAKYLDRLPITSTLNIVVLFDGNGKNDSYIWSTRGVGKYRPGLNQWRVNEIDNNMGSQQTLSQFVTWAYKNFPAQHYYLSIADHGRATSGTGFDTQGISFEGSDRLTIMEISAALQEATLNGAWHLDIVHFDSCLMGLFEVAYQIKNYADYMIASQNLAAAFYPYDRYAKLVLTNPGIPPQDLAIGIADVYANYDFLKVNGQPTTISVLDLSKADAVFTALDTVAQTMKDNVAGWSDLIFAARASTQKFDSTPEGSPPALKYFTITDQDEYVDLYDLANQLLKKGVQPAQELMTAINHLVIYNYAIPGIDRLSSNNYWDLGRSHGVSIYFPEAPNAFDYPRYISHTIFSLTVNSQWDDFLQAYFNVRYPQPLPPLPDPGVPPVLKPSIPITSYCPGDIPCLYGAVISDSLWLDGAVVTLQTATQQLPVSTAWVKDAGEHPVYRFFPLPDSLKEGDMVTLLAEYLGATHSLSIRLSLNPETKEQEVNLTFPYHPPPPDPEAPPPPITPTVEVAVTQAALWPTAITQGEGAISFRASAATSDNSAISEYRWHSNVDGPLGNRGSLVMPATGLSPGTHAITVIAVNEAGIVSNPVTLIVTIHAAPVPESRAIVQVGSVTVTPGIEFEVPIDVHELPNGQQLNGANLVLHYNPTRLIVNACGVDPDHRFTLALCNSSQQGVITLSVASGVGVTTSVQLAALRFQAVGQSELTTQLELDVKALVDGDNTPLTFIRRSGAVHIRPVVRGDVSCDERVGVGDSVFVLQYDVGQRQPATACPLPPTTINLPGCDVNDDTTCDVGDAQWILRCTVGDVSPFCSSASAVSASSDTQLLAPLGIAIHNGLEGNTYFVTIPLSVTVQHGSFGAATFELEYDPTKLTPLLCEGDPGQQFDGGFCNLNYPSSNSASGVIRFNLVSVQGVSGEQIIARMTFKANLQADDHTEVAVRIIKALDTRGANLVATWVDRVVVATGTEQVVRSVYLPWVQK